MCSEYVVKATLKEIEAALDAMVENMSGERQFEQTVKFHTSAPVIKKNNHGQIELATKIFPSRPMPNSRLSRIKGDEDETGSVAEDKQIERIYEIKSWKEKFKTHPVLIPMTEFREFAYWGKTIGTAQGFKIPNEKIMFAAGIEISPFVPKGPQDSGFSILTHTASAQMLDYHHRLIVLLMPKTELGFLAEMTPEERFNYLIENRFTGSLQVNEVRKMAPAWKRKIEIQTRKLENEMHYRTILEKENVAG